MDGVHDIQESETASVVKVSREPAIIINGVPALPPNCASGPQSEVRGALKSQTDPRFGEWLEGRKVRKLFGDKHYVGKVVKYDTQSNLYNVAYDNGNQEDLEWHELEEVLLPLDITIPLKTLVMDKCKIQSAVHYYGPGRPRKVYARIEVSKNKTSDMFPTPQGINVVGSQVMFDAENGLQPNNIPGLLPASTSSDATGASAPAVPKKRGRPRKDRTISGGTQPKRRGRPRKDRTISGGTQPKRRGRPPKNKTIQSYLALVPMKDASVAADMQEAHRKQNSVHRRNAQTAKAEKLKREKLRIQGATPGTQLF